VAQRAFNALNGDEFRRLVLREVQQELDLDARFSDPGAVTALTLLWRLRVESYPNEPATWSVQVSRVFKASAENPIPLRDCKRFILETITANLESDERFRLNYTYPKLSWAWSMPLEFAATGTVPKPALVQRKVNDHVIDHSQLGREMEVPPRDDRKLLRALYSEEPAPDLGTAPASPESVLVQALQKQIADMQQQFEAMKASIGGGSVEGGLGLVNPPVAVTPAEVRHHQIDNYTATGLKIEAGFEASPGAAMAGSFGSGSPVGSVQGREVVERAELGVTHPDLDHGGAGTADGMRRDAGLPVPQARTTPRGDVVDLGSDTF